MNPFEVWFGSKEAKIAHKLNVWALNYVHTSSYLKIIFFLPLFQNNIVWIFFMLGQKHPNITKNVKKIVKIIKLPIYLSHFIKKNSSFWRWPFFLDLWHGIALLAGTAWLAWCPFSSSSFLKVQCWQRVPKDPRLEKGTKR